MMPARRLRWTVALLASLAVCTAPASAGAVADGKLALRGAPGVEADLPKAFALFDSAARGGDPAAAWYLALMYKNGNGVPLDRPAAAHWMTVAASGGLPQAMFVLANMLATGDGVERNDDEARRWLEQANERDYPEAALAIAIALGNGSMGFPRDEARAAQQMKVAQHAMAHRPEEP
jgi:TPR repeat protein